MSADVRTAAIDVLSPLVGKTMATIYIAQTALNQEKTSETLEVGDLDCLYAEIRRMMGPYTTKAVVEDAIAEIAERVRP